MTTSTARQHPYSRMLSGLRTWAGSTLGALTPEDRDVVRAQHDLLALRQRDDADPAPQPQPQPSLAGQLAGTHRPAYVLASGVAGTRISAGPCPPVAGGIR